MNQPRADAENSGFLPVGDEASAQALLDNAFVAIFVARDRRFIRINRRTDTLFGYAPGELIGLSTEIIYPDHAAFLALGERAYTALGRGEVFTEEVELVRKDGSRFWCLMRAQSLAPREPLSGAIWILEDATERRQARQALEDAAELYRAIIDSHDVIKVLIDTHDGRIVDANLAAAEFYGYPREDLRQRYAWELTATPRAVFTAALAQLKTGDADLTVARTARHRRANGELCDVEIHLDLITRDNRTLLLATVLDLTARKAAEAALHASEERYRSAVVALAEGVAVYDLSGALITANPAAERILGLSTDAFRERPVDGADWRVIRLDGTPLPDDQWPSVVTLSTGIRQREVPMGVYRPDGSLSWILVSTEPLRDADTGTLLAAVVSFSDFTARKAAEDALRLSEERLQLVLDGANDGFWDWDVVTGEVFFSRRWAEMLGYEQTEIAPHFSSWEKLVHPDDLPRCSAALQDHFAGASWRYEIEHRLRTKSGEWCWVLDRGRVTARNAEGQPLRMAGTHTDITERRRVEDVLRHSLAEVQRNNAGMQALSRMSDRLLSCESRTEAYTIIARSAGRLFDGCTGALAMIGEDAAPDLRVVATWGDAQPLPPAFPLRDCWALRRGEMHEVTGPHQATHCRHFSGPPPRAYWCVPLTVRGETLGLLQISAGPAQTQASPADLRTLAIAVSESVKLALSNIRLQESLREQAIRDPLTGLFNRRYLDETLPRELQRSRRRGEPLAVAMLDLDHFKRFNDAYGHEAGDVVLRAVGALLKRSLRAGDIACRYGGEELSLILTGAAIEDARVRLEALRRAITEVHLAYQDGDLPAITVSIGIAAVEGQETDAAALLARADAALYRAKEAGRNRVIIAPQPDVRERP